jgi:phosphoribosylanthranilate isomerase
MKTLVKICGITNGNDALMAAEMGAHALGFVFYEESKRCIPPEKAKEIISELPPFLTKVGVFVGETWERMMEIRDYCKLDRVQIYGGNAGSLKNILPEITIMAFRIRSKDDIESARKSVAFPLLDSYSEKQYGGTGKQFDWELLASFGRPCIVAGGINAGNIDVVLKLNPYAIDIASGVESAPGVKDPNKLAAIFKKLKG